MNMATDERNAAEQPVSPEGTVDRRSTGLLRRIGGLATFARQHRLLAAAAGLAALAVVMAAVCVRGFLSGKKEKPITVAEALETLDAGLNDEAYQMGKRLKNSDNLPDDSYGAPAFIMGAALAYEADRSFAEHKRPYYLLSSRYLEQARDMGLPPDRQAEGIFQLGRTLFLSGQVAASRPVLEEALEAAPRHRSEILSLLTEAYLSDANPRYDQALAWNDKYLADRVLRPGERGRGLLQRARILLGLGRKEECLVTLEEIAKEGKDQAEALVIKAGVIMAEADGLLAAQPATPENRVLAGKKYDEAIEVLQAAQKRDTLSTQATRKAMFLTAVCLRRKEEYGKALEQFANTSRSNPETPESLAAEFETGEILRMQGNHKEALAANAR
ncbi:MAG: tetratricopeptide repeat protein [Thermoguttaceae bacterium]